METTLQRYIKELEAISNKYSEEQIATDETGRNRYNLSGINL